LAGEDASILLSSTAACALMIAMSLLSLIYLHPKNSFYKVGGNAGAKQHSQDEYIQEILNLGHALGTIIEAGLNALVPLGADCFVNTQTLVGLGG
jgi:hypothetical protein